MPFGRTASVTLISLLSWMPAMAEQSSVSASSKAPLPRPEILQIPPNTSNLSPAMPPSAPSAAVELEHESQEDARLPGDAGGSEDKEIIRPNAPKADRAGTAQGTGTLGRSTSRFSVFAELWPLLAVLVVIGVMSLVIKKFMPTRKFAFNSDVLRIVSRTPVGPKQTLMLVKLGRRLLLLGVSPEQIQALTTVDDPDQVAVLLGEAASGRADSMTRAFETSIREESEAYVPELDDEAEEDATVATRGQVQGLLNKVRQLAGRGD